MADLSMSSYSDDEGKKKKKKKVDACVGGKCGPTTRGKMSLSKFSPTKSKYNVGTVEKPKPDEDDDKVKKRGGNLHMNMRDLNSSPGDTRIYTNDAKTGTTDADVSKGTRFNLQTRKQKKNLRMSN